MQLRVVMETLLAQLRSLERVPGKEPVRALYPIGGYSWLPLRVERA
jgi:hypothetical protein